MSNVVWLRGVREKMRAAAREQRYMLADLYGRRVVSDVVGIYDGIIADDWREVRKRIASIRVWLDALDVVAVSELKRTGTEG